MHEGMQAIFATAQKTAAIASLIPGPYASRLLRPYSSSIAAITMP